MAIIKKFRIKSFKSTKPLIKLQRISLSFGKRQVLDDINFSVNQGEILGLLGPNGAGKTSTFNLAVGNLKPNRGDILMNQKSIKDLPLPSRSRLGLGYLTQENPL